MIICYPPICNVFHGIASAPRHSESCAQIMATTGITIRLKFNQSYYSNLHMTDARYDGCSEYRGCVMQISYSSFLAQLMAWVSLRSLYNTKGGLPMTLLV